MEMNMMMMTMMWIYGDCVDNFDDYVDEYVTHDDDNDAFTWV